MKRYPLSAAELTERLELAEQRIDALEAALKPLLTLERIERLEHAKDLLLEHIDPNADTPSKP